jgi:hypothetical protein
MNVEIGTEAAQYPEKEYINGIFVAVSTVHCTVRENKVLQHVLRKQSTVVYILSELGTDRP